MTKASDNAFPSILITEGTEPSAPAAGKQRLYIDSTTHLVMVTNSSGVESAVGGIALGAWTNYTPTITATTTNPTLGSSVVSGRYKLLDTKTGIVRVKMSITTGGAWNPGSGEWQFSLPASWTLAGTLACVGSVHILDSGTRRYAGIVLGTSGDTGLKVSVIADSSGDFVMKHNVPITWATGDSIDMQATVEIA